MLALKQFESYWPPSFSPSPEHEAKMVWTETMGKHWNLMVEQLVCEWWIQDYASKATLPISNVSKSKVNTFPCWFLGSSWMKFRENQKFCLRIGTLTQKNQGKPLLMRWTTLIFIQEIGLFPWYLLTTTAVSFATGKSASGLNHNLLRWHWTFLSAPGQISPHWVVCHISHLLHRWAAAG